MVKLVIHAIKRDISSCIADPDNKAKAKVENGDLTQDNPDVINMKLQQTTGTKVMTPTGSNMNKTLCKYCLVEVYVQILTQKANIQFDEIDGKGVPHVLTDLTLIKANGPKCSYARKDSVEYTHHFKVNSGASGKLLPLCLYRKIFRNVTQTELERSMDHGSNYLHITRKSSNSWEYVTCMLRIPKAIPHYVNFS